MSIKPPFGVTGTTSASPSAAALDTRLTTVERGAIYVESYRATAVNDTDTVQAAFNALAARQAVIFERGRTYTVKNLTIPDVTGIKIRGNGAKIVATSGQGEDASYLIASQRWVENTSSGSGLPYVHVDELEVDATGRTAGWVVMSRRFHMHRVEVYGGDTNVKQDAQTKNGTDLAASMVECRYTECSFHEATNYNFWSNDPTASGHSTDGFIEDCLIFNAGVANIKLDRLGGWKLDGVHTYQYSGFSHGDPFGSAAGWDLDVLYCGDAGRIVDCYFESGNVRIRNIAAQNRPRISGCNFGLTGGVGPFVDLQVASGAQGASVTLTDCEFYGPTATATYETLQLTGPVSGSPFRVYIVGGHFGYRAPIFWGANQVKVFTRDVSIYQSGQSVPVDLVVDGFVPTSGARPPGIVYRTAAPSGGTEAFVVGDRWMHTAPAAGSPPGGYCTVAGSPGTWVNLPNL